MPVWCVLLVYPVHFSMLKWLLSSVLPDFTWLSYNRNKIRLYFYKLQPFDNETKLTRLGFSAPTTGSGTVPG